MGVFWDVSQEEFDWESSEKSSRLMALTIIKSGKTSQRPVAGAPSRPAAGGLGTDNFSAQGAELRVLGAGKPGVAGLSRGCCKCLRFRSLQKLHSL